MGRVFSQSGSGIMGDYVPLYLLLNRDPWTKQYLHFLVVCLEMPHLRPHLTPSESESVF